MTNEEAIKLLRKYKPIENGWCSGLIELENNKGGLAIEMAIEALEKQSHICESCERYDHDEESCNHFAILCEPEFYCKDWKEEE